MDELGRFRPGRLALAGPVFSSLPPIRFDYHDSFTYRFGVQYGWIQTGRCAAAMPTARAHPQ